MYVHNIIPRVQLMNDDYLTVDLKISTVVYGKQKMPQCFFCVGELHL